MRTSLRLTRNTLVLLASAGLVLARPAHAQRGSAGLIGKIFDERTNEAMADALIFVDSLRHDIPISGQGRFVLTQLRVGLHHIEIRAVGYRPHRLEVILAEGQVLEQEFAMVFSGEKLPELAVEGRNSKVLPRFADFERRRHRGIGAYITREEIRAKGYMNMGDALRTIQGVKVDCGVVECLIHMARSTAGCHPTFYVDGRLVRSFAESTPINDVQGIEIYRGAAEMPGEFSGAGAMCGVIVIWTRAAP